MKWSIFFSFVLYIKAIEGGLISQSSIQSCDWGDSNEPTTKDGGGCKEKFVVSMTLKSGQGEVEALYANINQVHTSTDSGPSSLKKPFRIEVSKSQTITNYRVYYRGSVNGLPHEHTRIFSRAGHCHDGWYEQNLACGKQRSLDSSEEFAWDSQGFCCKCSSYIREIKRSKGVCVGGIEEWFKYKAATGYTTYFPGRKSNFGSSAHCMRMHDLWYDVYDIELPMMLYNISVRLLQYGGKIVDMETGTEMTNWTTISTFYLTPSKTMGRSKDGKVVVELQGDLVGANGPYDFSVKKLLIPSLKVWQPTDENPVPPPAYTNGPGDWLLVDDHLIDMSGQQCNKVGVSYTGFKRQNSPCDKPEHSCFTNQPLQLWTHDDELRKAGKRGTYMVHNFGKVHPSTHATNHSFILRFIHTDLHNSFVTFRIDASDIVFVYNAAKGRIVDAYATKFTAVKEVGQLYVEVENTGQLESEYSVVLSECLGRQSTPSKVVTILPGCIANISFSLQSYKTKGENSLCEVQLFDKSFNLLGSAKVDVAVKGACFCFGECGCSCGSETGSVGNSTALPCATPPPVVISKSNLARDVFFLVLESVGIHGIVGFSGGILLLLGCIKLMCGGILCCRKTKAQEHYDNLIKKGVDPKSPALVKCTGECRGAKAALARYKRKVERLKKIGKDPGFLDDWRNTSYVCGCRDELADIRFAYIIKAVCFYYYCLVLPFIWLGKKIWWAVFKDTAAKKEAAEKAVLNAAKKKGNMEKYGVIDLAAELKNIEEERNELRGEAKNSTEQQGTDQKIKQHSAGDGAKQSIEKAGYNNEKGDKNNTRRSKKEKHSAGVGDKQCTKKAGDNNEKGDKDSARKKLMKDKVKQPKMDTSPKSRKPKAESNTKNFETAEYREGPRAQDRPPRRGIRDSGMKSSKQRSAPKRQDDKHRSERMKGVAGKSTVRSTGSKAAGKSTMRSTGSKAASHCYQHSKQQGKQPLAKSKESLSLASGVSTMQLADDTNSKDGKDKVAELADDARLDSHTSLTPVDGFSEKPSIDKIKSDTSSKNLGQESNASLVSDPHCHSQQCLNVCASESHMTKPILSQPSNEVNFVPSVHHSDVTMAISSQHSIGTPSNTDQMTSCSESCMKSTSRQQSISVQRVHSDQFAVSYLTGGRISVVMHSSDHSHDSDNQARSHSEEIKQPKSSPSVQRQSMDSITTSEGSGASSKISTYSDPSMGGLSYYSTSSVKSSSTNAGSIKFSSTTSISRSAYTGSTKSSFTHSASSLSATGTSSSYSSGKTSSSSHERTVDSSSDLSKTYESHDSPSNQLVDIQSTESHISGMELSLQSQHSVSSDELEESSSKSFHHSEVESTSEVTSSEESEEFDDDSGSGQESSEYSKGSQDYFSEETKSESSTSGQSSAFSTTSRSQSESHSSTRSTSESASSAELTSHSQ